MMVKIVVRDDAGGTALLMLLLVLVMVVKVKREENILETVSYFGSNGMILFQVSVFRSRGLFPITVCCSLTFPSSGQFL